MELSIRIGGIKLSIYIIHSDYNIIKGIFRINDKHIKMLSIHPTKHIDIGIQLLL